MFQKHLDQHNSDVQIRSSQDQWFLLTLTSESPDFWLAGKVKRGKMNTEVTHLLLSEPRRLPSSWTEEKHSEGHDKPEQGAKLSSDFQLV